MPTGKGVLAELCDELAKLYSEKQIKREFARNYEGHLYGAIRIYPNGGAADGTVYVVLINRGDGVSSEVYKVVNLRQVASKIITYEQLIDLLQIIKYTKNKLIKEDGVEWE